jgi:hypothetical protein
MDLHVLESDIEEKSNQPSDLVFAHLNKRFSEMTASPVVSSSSVAHTTPWKTRTHLNAAP